jgi:hypothetical protein
MNKNKIKFSEIKTPKTINEFRENLRKYYITSPNGEYLVEKNNKILIDEIYSLSDLYKTNRETPTIIPMVDWNFDDVEKYMKKTGELFSSAGYFTDDSNDYSIYKNKSKFMSSGKSCWVGIDNQIIREFYVKTLGKFSGYV